MNDEPKLKPPEAANQPVGKAQVAAEAQRGLLDLSVELSTRDMTAGEEFAIYVLVKNPFMNPVWIDRVHLSLPSELINPKKEEFQRQIKKEIEAEIEQMQRDRDFYKASLARIEKNLEIAVATHDSAHKSAFFAESSEIAKIKSEIVSITQKLATASAVFKISMFDISLDITTAQAAKLQGLATTRELDLDSSLSADLALQPSSTAVYTAVLNVKRPLFRPPSKFRLQISVVYSLSKSNKDSSTFTNTVAHEITIRPALKSLLYGSSLGGVCGAVGRMLQTGGVKLDLVTWSGTLSFLISIVLAVLLSAIAIIFMARKSDAQPFISVEDFWGGLLIGFLVGYTGTSFFSELTHIAPPKTVG